MNRAILMFPLLCAAACRPTIDLGKSVAPESVTTGWADGGTITGKHKIVPVVSFKLKNVSDQELRAVQVNAVFRRVNEIAPGLPVILVTAFGTTDTAIEAMKQGAFDYLVKPLDAQRLRDVVLHFRDQP